MPAGLAAQQDLLRGLLAFSQADPDVKWLVMGCSLARGAGDRLSDIDAAVGVLDEQLPGALLLGEVGGQLDEEQRGRCRRLWDGSLSRTCVRP